MDNTHHHIDTLKSLGDALNMRDEVKNLLNAAEAFVEKEGGLYPDEMSVEEQVEFWLHHNRRDYRSALAEFSKAA